MGDDNFTLISFSSTGSGVLQKPMNNEIIGIGIAQEGPVPENIPCTVCVRHDFNTWTCLAASVAARRILWFGVSLGAQGREAVK